MEQKSYSVTILMENWVKKLGFYGISGIKLCGYPSYSFLDFTYQIWGLKTQIKTTKQCGSIYT